ADLLPVAHLEADARGFARLGVEQHDLAQIQGGRLLDDAALLLRGGLHVALHEVHPLDDHRVALHEHLAHPSALALVVAADDDHLVAYSYPLHSRTSGASEMIFMKRRARSSRATGPKMRVTTGSI